jgi:hypothetical protein
MFEHLVGRNENRREKMRSLTMKVEELEVKFVGSLMSLRLKLEKLLKFQTSMILKVSCQSGSYSKRFRLPNLFEL